VFALMAVLVLVELIGMLIVTDRRMDAAEREADQLAAAAKAAAAAGAAGAATAAMEPDRA
jgi:hypothetical protein